MNYLRLLIGAGLALVVTVSLFILMPSLIKGADRKLDEKETYRMADITMPKREIEANLKALKPEKPKDPEQPPPDMAPPEFENIDLPTDAISLIPQLQLDVVLGSGVSSSDGEFMPIVKVAPIYPRRANSRGIQGTCTVEYIVTKNGSVRNPVAIDCNPPGYFEKTSVKAALKFKYRPRIIDGVAIDVAGVQNRFIFRLEE